jgi:hypothetical protein
LISSFHPTNQTTGQYQWLVAVSRSPRGQPFLRPALG